MITLSVVCLQTNQLVYSYSCSDESYASIAEYRANKRFDLSSHRITLQSDYDHNFNKDLYIGYEIIGEDNNKPSPLEYAGQTGY